MPRLERLPIVERYSVYGSEPVTSPELNPYGSCFREIVWQPIILCRPLKPG